MKKIYVGLMVGMLLVPNITFAATNEDYQSLLKVLINLLQQQVLILTQQLQTLQASQGTTPTLGNMSIGTTAPTVIETPKDCTPQNEAGVYYRAGSITTGIDFMFYGTSTYPTGCNMNLEIESNLQTPTTYYNGRIGDWKNNGHIKILQNGFVFNQGWGSGEDMTPEGTFIWTIGSSTVTTTVSY